MAETTSTADKIFDALAEGSAAIMGRIKSGNERAYRIGNTLLGEVERGQKEALQLGRSFVKSPTDVAGFTATVFQKSGEAQDRAFELTRQFIDELATASRETRETARRVSQAGLDGGRATLDAARGLFTWTRGAIEAAVPTRGASAPQTGTTTRTPRRSSEEAA